MITINIDWNWILVIAGVVIGILLKMLFDESQSARLKIVGNSKSPLFVGPKYWVTGTGFDNYYTTYRVRIENEQKRYRNCAAENCLVWLELENAPEPYQICWAGDFTDVIINAGDLRELEFCARGNATGKIYIPTEKGYFDPSPREIGDGKSELRGKLRITCMGARKAERKFVIKPINNQLEIVLLEENDESRSTLAFKPLPWGTLFFSFWVTLRVVNNPDIWMKAITWFFLVLSGVLWLSLFAQLMRLTKPLSSFIKRKFIDNSPRLKRMMISQNIGDFLLLTAFFVTLLGFPTNVVLDWDKLSVFDKSISIIGLLCWMVGYIWAMLATTARRGRTGKIVGFIFSIFIFLNAMYVFRTNDVAGWTLIGISIISIIVVIRRPKSWNLQDLV